MHDTSFSSQLSGGKFRFRSSLDPAVHHHAAPIRQLRATTRSLDIAGRAVTVKGLLDGLGRIGLTLDPGEAFRVDLINELVEETIIHWHGQHRHGSKRRHDEDGRHVGGGDGPRRLCF